MSDNVVVNLLPGKSVPISPNSNVIVNNETNKPGQVKWTIDPPVVTEGIVDVPAHETRTLPSFGNVGGTVQNTGDVPLRVDIQTRP